MARTERDRYPEGRNRRGPAGIPALRTELRESGLRIEARLEALKSDVVTRVFTMILAMLAVNIVALVGAMFGVARLLGH